MKDRIKENLLPLRQRCLDCRACPLGGVEVEPGHFSNVFSNMNLTPKQTIMVIGQNPGRDECINGQPFVGASGKFFDKALSDILSMKREDFYISNVLRCHTPGNRHPTVSELESCRPILDEEIHLLNPILLIALGAVAFERLTGMHGIMKHHAEFVMSTRYLVPVLPLLHPSPYNTNNPVHREAFYKGLRKVREFLSQNG